MREPRAQEFYVPYAVQRHILAVFISPISNDIIYCIAVFLYIHWTLCFMQSVLMYCYVCSAFARALLKDLSIYLSIYHDIIVGG